MGFILLFFHIKGHSMILHETLTWYSLFSEEEYEPPKTEVKEISEDDALFSKR